MTQDEDEPLAVNTACLMAKLPHSIMEVAAALTLPL
jgi:hypothetical protein